MVHIPLPPPCQEHHSKYGRGCPDCQAYRRAVNNRANKLSAYGVRRPVSLVPAAAARAHLAALNRKGMPWQQIAAEAGMDMNHVRAIGQGRVKTVRPETEATLLAVRWLPFDTGRLRDATGTHRRLRALARMGYSQTQISALAGHPRDVGGSSVANWMITKYVTERVYNEVKAVYDKYCMVPSDGARPAAVRAKAEAKGWAPPLAWDDETIDDPRAKPNFGRAQGYELPDEAAIDLTMAGHRHKVGRPLNNAEKRISIERAFELGLSDSATAELVGIRRGSVCATRLRMRERAKETEP